MKSAFCFGALGYPLLELLYRGRSHYSMMIAGGMSSLLIARMRHARRNFLTKSLLCGLGVTAIEYLCGRIWNRNHQVWDYRNQALNYQGQICLHFTALWCLLSAGYMAMMTLWERIKGSG